MYTTVEFLLYIYLNTYMSEYSKKLLPKNKEFLLLVCMYWPNLFSLFKSISQVFYLNTRVTVLIIFFDCNSLSSQ